MAKKTAKQKPCKCLEQVQKSLAKDCLELETALQVNFTTGRGEIAGPFLAVRWKDKPVRGKKKPLICCAYCPICGKKKP